VGILLDRHTRNGTLIVEEGTVTFGNSINNNRDTNVIQDTERSLILQVNRGEPISSRPQPQAQEKQIGMPRSFSMAARSVSTLVTSVVISTSMAPLKRTKEPPA
jgi:hypothetical protein